MYSIFLPLPAAHGSQITALPAHFCRHINCWKISLSRVDCQLTNIFPCALQMSLQSHVNCYGVQLLRQFCVNLGEAYVFNIGKLYLVCKYIDVRYACFPEYCVLGNTP
jgi:hypothetical protein